MLNEIVKIVEHKKIFKRNKERDIETKILGVLLYHLTLSYRDTSKILGITQPTSYEVVLYLYNQFKELFFVEC